jgi:alcohol dehydrogenase
MKPFIFSTTKSIISEIGAIKRIANICSDLDISKPLVITDQGIVDVGLMQPLDTAFKNAAKEYFCFDQVVADPPEHIVQSAVAYAKEHKVDGIIGFGGGSSLDTAKLVALLANSDELLTDIYGVDAIRGKRLPLILIPTTAGTGSEVTPIAIVTTGNTTKAGVVSSVLLPDIALLDASLTLGLPSHVTAATGIDAMVHAIEAYTSAIKKNPYSDLLAKQALTLLSNNIVEATFNGTNVEARQAMLLGACLAGQAFANAPVAAVHALAYPLGGHFHIPHGLSNALVLVQVMSFNLSHSADLYAELAPSISDAISLDASDKEIAQALIGFIAGLIKQLKLPVSLSEMGIGESDINTLANDAMLQTRLLVNNPKPVTLEDVKKIYRQAHLPSST